MRNARRISPLAMSAAGHAKNLWTISRLRSSFSRVRSFYLAALLCMAACSTGGAQFTTQTADSFVPAPHTVSVLGVYKEGRMALGTWEKLGPHLVQALGSARCDVAFDSLTTSNQELADAIDEYAREEGPTGNLLAKLAPAARGDLVMVITFAGRPPEQAEKGPPEGAPVFNGMGTRRKVPGRARNGGAGAYDPNAVNVSASLFSVAQKHPVALVRMIYHGENADDAMTRFGAEIARAIPGSKCVGWHWDVKIDRDTLHTTDLE
jgi:hypothetical protein